MKSAETITTHEQGWDFEQAAMLRDRLKVLRPGFNTSMHALRVS